MDIVDDSAQPAAGVPLPADSASELAHIPLFRGLDAGQLARLRACMQHRVYQPLERIMEQGEEGHDLHVVISGRVSLMDEGRGRRDWLSTAVGAGELFGEIGFLTGQPRTLSAVNGPEPGHQMVLNRFDFERLAWREPAIGYVLFAELLRQIASRLDELPEAHRNYILWGYGSPA